MLPSQSRLILPDRASLRLDLGAAEILVGWGLHTFNITDHTSPEGMRERDSLCSLWIFPSVNVRSNGQLCFCLEFYDSLMGDKPLLEEDVVDEALPEHAAPAADPDVPMAVS